MYDALQSVKEDGFLPENFKAEAKDYTFAYKMSENRFVILQKGKVVYPERISTPESVDLWKFSDDGQNLTDGYSYYLRGFVTTPVNVSAGLDVGENVAIPSINYSDTEGKDVVIRTNSASTTLTIDAPLGTVNHYGVIGKVDAQRIDLNHCYNEYGTAAYIKLTEGKVVAKAGGKIEVVFAANNDKDAVAVIKETNGTIERGLTVIEPVSTTNEARTNGIPLEFSVDGVTAASKTAEELAAELTTRTEEVQEIAQEAINTAIENTVFAGVAISKARQETQLMTFEAFRDTVNAGNTYAGYTVKLLDNIDLKNSNWTPLKLFAGTFDGNNKTLSGLKLNESTDISSGYFDIGFFEKTEDATIKNLTIDGFEIYGTGRVSSGTLVGNASNGLTLKNVIVTSTNKLTGKWSGGLMGRTSVTMDGSNKRDCKYIIDNCHSSVEIIGERTGGFVGQMDGCNNSIYNSSNGFATFTSCSFDGNVNANKGTAMAAGFVAQFTGGDRTWFVYTYQNCSVNDATIDSSGSKGDFTAVSQSAFSIFNCKINDENVILPTQVNFAFCNSKTVYAYSINGTIYAIKAANGDYYNVESDTIGVDAQVAGSSDHSISLSDTTDWHKVSNAYTDFYGNYIVSADASVIYRSVPTHLEQGTKLQRRTYVAGHDYSANQDTYSFDMWRIVNSDVEPEGTGFGQWQDVGDDGSTGFVLGPGIYYYLDPTDFIDPELYDVSSRETSDHWMIYTVTAK